MSAEIAQFEVAIVGGGMVGASLALALAQANRKVVLIEATPFGSAAQPSFDERTTALGNSSRRIFQALGVWSAIEPQAAAIKSIHVSDAGRFGFARLAASEQGIDAFGYVAANRVIGRALWEKLEACSSNLALRVPAKLEGLEIESACVKLRLTPEESLTSRLVVAADGAHSLVRSAAGIDAEVEDYGQVAVVATLRADETHNGTAYERFTSSGPLALLPLHDGSYAVVWALAPVHAHAVLELSDAAFLAEVQKRFGWRAGKFVTVGRRGSYPLQLTRATRAVGPRSVLIGNAAQALHPVAGQGFNLGLRDAAMLAETLVGSPEDPGSSELLAKFAEWRSADRSGVTRFTDGLVKLFGDARPGVGTVRDLGLLLFDLLPPAKSALARVSTGFGGPSPRLARGLQL